MRIERIDHVHVEVADREEAAAWFHDVLGLVRADALADWATHPLGPLILATPDGLPVLSLFAREAKPASRDATIAFRVSGAGFLAFLERAERVGLGPVEPVDHDKAWSVYFMDPWGNRFEVTSYDYAALSLDLKGRGV